jgi:hypothetical protein
MTEIYERIKGPGKEREMEYRFETPGTPKIEVRLSAGRLEVSTHPGDETIVRLAPLRDNSASRKAVENARVELIGNGNNPTVLVDVRAHSGLLPFQMGTDVEVTVEAPEGAHLKAGVASADVTTKGKLSSLDANTASGRITAGDVAGKVAIRSASGDVRLPRVGGDLTVHSASADVEAGIVAGAATIRTASGDTKIRDAASSVTVHTASGDALVGAIRQGRVSLQSASGDLEVGIPPGVGAQIDARSMSGEVTSDLDVTSSNKGPSEIEVNANTMSGDIRIRRAAAGTRSSSSQPVHLA